MRKYDNYQQMFEQTRFEEVLVKIKIKQKEDQAILSITINQDGDVYLQDLIRKITQIIEMDESTDILYFDSIKNAYCTLQEQENLFLPFSYIVNENVINLRIQTRISDQLLANPVKTEIGRPKRSPERLLCEVLQLVETWRSLYTKRSFNQKGEVQKVNLDKAALITGVPRKSLEDYYLLLRNGYNYKFDFNGSSRKKVGVLRNFVKERKKIKLQQTEKQKQKQKQKQKNEKYEELILAQIRKQMYGLTMQQYEEELFKVVRHSSSDEDQIYQGMHEE